MIVQCAWRQYKAYQTLQKLKKEKEELYFPFGHDFRQSTELMNWQAFGLDPFAIDENPINSFMYQTCQRIQIPDSLSESKQKYQKGIQFSNPLREIVELLQIPDRPFGCNYPHPNIIFTSTPCQQSLPKVKEDSVKDNTDKDHIEQQAGEDETIKSVSVEREVILYMKTACLSSQTKVILDGNEVLVEDSLLPLMMFNDQNSLQSTSADNVSSDNLPNFFDEKTLVYPTPEHLGEEIEENEPRFDLDIISNLYQNLASKAF